MFIELNKINSIRQNRHTDTDEPGENGGHEDVVVVSQPVTVAAASIRCFYARRNEEPGTRITFNDGGGFAVTELYDEVKAKIAEAAAPSRGGFVN